MKRGRPPNTEVFRVIPEILRDRPMCTPGALKRLYQQYTGRGIGYDTVKRALESLQAQGLLEAQSSNDFEGKRRRVVVYSLKE